MAVFKIERNYTKEEIMEFYVNDPFLGSNTYGVEQACQKYFGKSVHDLSLAEASLIAGIFNAPTTLNPFYSIENAENRRSIVLNLMVRHGYTTKEQAEEAKSIKIETLLNKSLFDLFIKILFFISIISNLENKNNDLIKIISLD